MRSARQRLHFVVADFLLDRENLFAWFSSEVALNTNNRSQRAVRRCVVCAMMMFGASCDGDIVERTLWIASHTGINTGQVEDLAMNGKYSVSYNVRGQNALTLKAAATKSRE